MTNERPHGLEDEQLHEGTAALEELAAEVEQERAERGRSEFAAPDQPREETLADAAQTAQDADERGGDQREVDTSGDGLPTLPLASPGHQGLPH